MPRRSDSIVDDLVKAPWWVSAALALLVYLSLPGLLPAPVVAGGLVGIIAMVLLALSAISALRSLTNRSLLDAQTGLDSLRALPWKRFEDVLGEAYRRQGYGVEEMLGGGADGGVDLVLRKNGDVAVVQCKRWKDKRVPVQTVRELYGVMIDRRASAAKIVATTNFTPDAVAFAKDKPIELVDSKALLLLVEGVQTSAKIVIATDESDHLTPACPSCSTSMVLRKARRGQNAGQKFWGCARYPQCRGTRALNGTLSILAWNVHATRLPPQRITEGAAAASCRGRRSPVAHWRTRCGNRRSTF